MSRVRSLFFQNVRLACVACNWLRLFIQEFLIVHVAANLKIIGASDAFCQIRESPRKARKDKVNASHKLCDYPATAGMECRQSKIPPGGWPRHISVGVLAVASRCALINMLSSR